MRFLTWIPLAAVIGCSDDLSYYHFLLCSLLIRSTSLNFTVDDVFSGRVFVLPSLSQFFHSFACGWAIYVRMNTISE